MEPRNASYPEQSRSGAAHLLVASRTDGTEPAVAPPLFDFMSVWRVLRRRFKLVLLFTVFCIGVALFVHSLFPRTYSASARVLLDEEKFNPFGKDEIFIFSDLSLTNPVVETQMQVMRSPYLLSQVVERLRLDADEEFMDPEVPQMRARIDALLNRVLALVGIEIEEPVALSEEERFRAAVEKLRENLEVSRNAEDLVIRIRYSSPSSILAARIVNAVARTYIDNRVEKRRQSAERAAKWFEERMAELAIKALEVEKEIVRLSGGGVDILDSSRSTAALQEARISLQNAMAERARTQIELARLRAIRESGRGLRGIPSTLAVGPLRQLIEDAEAARLELADELRSQSEDTPKARQLRARISALEASGRSMLETLIQEATARAEAAEQSETEAQQAFEVARGEIGRGATNAIEVQLRTLEGEARIYRELQERYLASYLRTVQQQSFPSTEATIIETAQPPEFPDGPGRSRLALLATLIGLTLGAGGVSMLEASDRSIRTLQQLARCVGAPALGLLPRTKDRSAATRRSSGKTAPPAPVIKDAEHRNGRKNVVELPKNRITFSPKARELRLAVSDPLSHAADAIRRVIVEADRQEARTRIEQIQGRVLGFVSDQPSKGRSIAAINCAELLAVGGSRTLLVDLDWSSAFLSGTLAPTATAGFAELLLPERAASLEEILWYDPSTSLHFLPNRSLATAAHLDAAVFDPERISLLILRLASRFDNVVLDLSPMAESSDPAALASVASGFVAVAEWGETRSTSLAAELKRATISRPQLLGALLYGISRRQLQRYEPV